MKRTFTAFGEQFGLFSLMLFLAGTAAAQNCGGKERWGPKDGTDSQAQNIDLTKITDEHVTDLVTISQPQLPDGNTTRIVPDETHVYRVQARLIKWKRESDNDYHLVLTDDTLNYTEESAPIADALVSAHGELDSRTKTALARATVRAAEAAATATEPIEVRNTAQLRDLAAAAARLFCWDKNQGGNVTLNQLVITQEQLEQIRALREQADTQESPSDTPRHRLSR